MSLPAAGIQIDYQRNDREVDCYANADLSAGRKIMTLDLRDIGIGYAGDCACCFAGDTNRIRTGLTDEAAEPGLVS